ncbi:hypothetical protein RM844_04625 [Streptomyces sp. DSM 44915]|uniref:Uncharacterized protein n=1 Tax=Streptomyces chisholmiae TaxID=3075540 RepID=A0ABU2JLG3_9ACTN|nr:hypothetical protein [Streptomyces sp. DSM 44915]MDT0265573.1 hypothetical protein [Streptomyces sp. DSM 44915]
MTDEALTPVILTVTTVRRRDVVTIGGQQLRVSDLHTPRAGYKLVIFESGEILTMTPRTWFSGVRPVPVPSSGRRPVAPLRRR